MDSKITPLYYDYTPIELGEGKIYKSPMEYIAEDAQNQAMTAALYDDMINNQLPEFLANIPYLDKDKYDKLAGEYTAAIDGIARTLSENPYDKNAQRSIAELATRFRKDISPQGKLGLMAANKEGLDVWMQNNLPYATTDPETYEKMYEKKKGELLTNTDPYEIPNIISQNIVEKPNIYDKDKMEMAAARMADETNNFKLSAENDNQRIAGILTDYINDERFLPYLRQKYEVDGIPENIAPFDENGIVNPKHPFAEELRNMQSVLKGLRYNNRPSLYKSGGSGSGSSGSSGSKSKQGSGYDQTSRFGQDTDKYNSYNISFTELYNSSIKKDKNFDDITNEVLFNQMLSKVGLTREQGDYISGLTGDALYSYVDATNISENKKKKALVSSINNFFSSIPRQLVIGGKYGQGSKISINGRNYTIEKFMYGKNEYGDTKSNPHGVIKHIYDIRIVDDKTGLGINFKYSFNAPKDVNPRSSSDDVKRSYYNKTITPDFNIEEIYDGLKKQTEVTQEDMDTQALEVMSFSRNAIKGDKTKNAFLDRVDSFWQGSLNEKGEAFESKGVSVNDPKLYKKDQVISKITLGAGSDLVIFEFSTGQKMKLDEQAATNLYASVYNTGDPMVKFLNPNFLKFYSYMNSKIVRNRNNVVEFDTMFSNTTSLPTIDDYRIRFVSGVPLLQRKDNNEWKDVELNSNNEEEPQKAFYNLFAIFNMITGN